MIRARLLLAFVFSLLVIVPVQAQEPPADLAALVDAQVSEHRAALNIPGMAVAIVRGDEIAYMQGYGVADSAGRAITPQTPFWLASVSKSITATAIMQLVESGQIDLDAPVTAYLPWFREGMGDPTPITTRMLLNQTSGFSRYSGHELIADNDLSDDALERNARRLSSAPLLFAPGTDWTYSNSNYDLLGYLIQTVSGQSYESYIEEHIFTPLEMRHAYTRVDQAEGMSEGYYPLWGDFRPLPTQFSRAVTPSAGLIASVEDLARYVIAHLNGGQSGGASILSAQGIAETHRSSYALDQYNAYAFGWFAQPLWAGLVEDGEQFTAPVLVTHDGAWHNFRSVVALLPAYDLGIIVLINANDFQRESLYTQIAPQLAALIIGAEPQALFSYEDGFTQNAKLIAVGVFAVQLLLLAWSVINLLRWRRSPRRWTTGRAIVPPLIFDALLAVYVLWGVPLQFEAPLLVTMRLAPDTGFLIAASLVVSVGWGAARTILYVAALRGQRHGVST